VVVVTDIILLLIPLTDTQTDSRLARQGRGSAVHGLTACRRLAVAVLSAGINCRNGRGGTNQMGSRQRLD